MQLQTQVQIWIHTESWCPPEAAESSREGGTQKENGWRRRHLEWILGLGLFLSRGRGRGNSHHPHSLLFFTDKITFSYVILLGLFLPAESNNNEKKRLVFSEPNPQQCIDFINGLESGPLVVTVRLAFLRLPYPLPLEEKSKHYRAPLPVMAATWTSFVTSFCISSPSNKPSYSSLSGLSFRRQTVLPTNRFPS